MLFRTLTLGCRVNQYETEYVRSALLASGWGEAGREDFRNTDLVVVNTCSVTAESDAKSRKLIAGAAAESPRARIVVMGCFAASNPEKARSCPNVTDVLTDKRELPGFIARQGWTVPDGIRSFGSRHRAYVKIQDGCRVGCSYCIIPKVRPYLASRAEGEILREAGGLAERGFREIVLTGIHLGHYGLDLVSADRLRTRGSLYGDCTSGSLGRLLELRRFADEGTRHSLADLLRALLRLRLGVRFRLGSLEAVEVSDELVDIFAGNPEWACPQFHLSMQSGDDAVLARMRRRWPSGPYIERCRTLLEKIPGAAITTDVIVGFPGETDAEFERTCEVVREIGFAKVHIFRYSRRPGTEAAEMPNQVPEPVKKERAARLAEIAGGLRVRYAQSLVGKEATVLVETQETAAGGTGGAVGGGTAAGTSALGTVGATGEGVVRLSGVNEYYIPVDIERRVRLDSEGRAPCMLGELARVRLAVGSGERLRGEAIGDSGSTS